MEYNLVPLYESTGGNQVDGLPPAYVLQESTFQFVLCLRVGLRIFSIDVEAADTIDNVKDKIQDKEAPRPISSV